MKDYVADGTTYGLLLDEYTYLSNIHTLGIEYKDAPFFWDDLQGGGEKIKEFLKSCMLTVIASEVGSVLCC